MDNRFNTGNPIVNAILAPLRAINVMLLQTGSRFFGTDHETSDWDYIVWSEEEKLQEVVGIDFYLLLEALGWKEKKGSGSLCYGSSFITKTFRQVRQGVQVDIMVVYNVSKIIYARNLIRDAGIAYLLTDQNRNWIWDNAVKIAESYHYDDAVNILRATVLALSAINN
jgi:hypothetical protein